MSEEKFIKCFNLFLERGEKYLSEYELYLYTFLYMWSNFEFKINASINLISNSIKFVSNQSDNRGIIRESLTLLKKKGILFLTENILAINANDVFVIKLKIEELEKSSDNMFAQVFFSEWRKIDEAEYETNKKRMRDFHILCNVARYRHRQEGFICSYNRWADLLGVSVPQAKRDIKEAKERGIIHVFSGRYIGENEQEPNCYFVGKELVSIAPSEKDAETNVNEIEEKTFFEGRKDEQKNNENVPDNGTEIVNKVINENPSNTEETRKHNWYNKDRNVFPDENDYYILATTKDSKLKNLGEKRIELLSKSPYGKQKVEEGIRSADLKLKNEKMKEEEKEKKREERELINCVKNSKGLVIERDNQGIIEIVDMASLQYNDVVLRNVEEFIGIDPNPIQRVERVSVSNLILGNTSSLEFDEWIEVSDDVKSELFNKYITLLQENDFNVALDYLDEFRRNLFQEKNRNKDVKEDWEGDIWSFNSVILKEENVSKKDRLKRRIKKK